MDILLQLWNSFVGFLPQLLAAIVAFFVCWVIKIIVMKLVMKAVKKKFDPLMHMFIKSAISILLWTVIIVVVMGVLGLNTASIITALGAAGVAIGLALQGSLSNIASGVLLIVSKVIKGGDYVSINGIEGSVVSTDLMFTHLNTVDNKHVAVPNSGITANNIINYSFNETRRVDLEFTVSYQDDVTKVKDILNRICATTDGVLNDPAPFVKVLSYDDSAVRMVVRAWTKRDDYWDVYFGITEKVKSEFDNNGITIPYNQIDVHFFPPVEK
ncbi:MAG: mechanosensitive ion channel [Clostridia bacterium]|nr:mechanosensitive ion channel [Clostridia bacterium]